MSGEPRTGSLLLLGAASAASLALTPLLRAVLRSTPERQVVYQQGPIEFSQQPPDVGTMVSLVF